MAALTSKPTWPPRRHNNMAAMTSNWALPHFLWRTCGSRAGLSEVVGNILPTTSQKGRRLQIDNQSAQLHVCFRVPFEKLGDVGQRGGERTVALVRIQTIQAWAVIATLIFRPKSRKMPENAGKCRKMPGWNCSEKSRMAENIHPTPPSHPPPPPPPKKKKKKNRPTLSQPTKLSPRREWVLQIFKVMHLWSACPRGRPPGHPGGYVWEYRGMEFFALG